MSTAPDGQRSHEDAVINAEARHLIRVLAPYRVLHRDALSRLADSSRWHECSFERALAEAVRSGGMESLPGGFYSYAEGSARRPVTGQPSAPAIQAEPPGGSPWSPSGPPQGAGPAG